MQEAISEIRNDKKDDIAKHCISGGLAGIFVDMVFYPLDTLKTRRQSYFTSNYYPPLYRLSGIRTLYCGFMAAVIGSFSASATFFGIYEYINRLIGSKERRTRDIILASVISEICSSIIRYPFETIKQNAQVVSDTYSLRHLYKFKQIFLGIPKDLLSIWHPKSKSYMIQYGMFALYIRDIPFIAIELSLWEYIKTYSLHREFYSLNTMGGALSGGIAAALTMPMDALKTRILTSKYPITRCHQVISIIKSIWKVHGIKGFFNGMSYRITLNSLGGYLYLGAFETFLNKMSA
ncbi:carrier protein [Cryptosporidium andersoni]|uniref:Carrier protein n=1 Tax=Cryptosporidium andersoni TaxID=117008 RepID=A0A1J4MPU0_9CRYT|nr:carrier protein [Cryptosporidium andersoni]